VKPTLQLSLILIALSLTLGACDTAAAQEPQLTVAVAKATHTDGPSPTLKPEPVSTPNAEQALELADLGWIAFTASDGGRRDGWHSSSRAAITLPPPRTASGRGRS